MPMNEILINDSRGGGEVVGGGSDGFKAPAAPPTASPASRPFIYNQAETK